MPAGPERARAQIEIGRDGIVDVTSGIRGFRLLRLGGSAFKGFVRDEYTTLPDLQNRPLHMWLDLEWKYLNAEGAFTGGAVTKRVRHIVRDVFRTFESGSIQQVIYQMGTRLLAGDPRNRRSASRSEQSHLGYDCREGRLSWASTPTLGLLTGVSGLHSGERN